METIQLDILAISGAMLLIATFGVIVRRGFTDWLNAYRYQSVVLAGVTAIIGICYRNMGDLHCSRSYACNKINNNTKSSNTCNKNLEIEFKTETNPYLSLRASVIISAFLVTMSYFLSQQIPFKSDPIVNIYLPVSMAQLFLGLFALVNRRTALSQVVGLLVIENGLFLFTLVLTHGVSLIIEIGIFADILVGIVISSILLFRISRTFDSLDVDKLENLRDD